MSTWDLMNGMSEYKPESKIGMLFYYMFTILTNITLLNIVISVISDTYEKVSLNRKQVQLAAKAELLYDYSVLISIFKSTPSDDDLKHLYIFRVKNSS